MTTYPPNPGPSEPEPPEPERRDETEDGGTPFSGNQPGPDPSGPEPGWNPPGANPEGVPHPPHGTPPGETPDEPRPDDAGWETSERPSGTPGETPQAPSDRPFGGIPPAPPPPGAGPGVSPSGSAGYNPYSGGAVPPPPPPPPAYNAEGPLRGQEPRNGLGTAALICGIVAIVLSFIPVLNTFTWPLGVLAIVFGAVGWSRANKGIATNKPIAITGLVLGIASFFTFCLIYVLIGAGGGMQYDAAPMF
jgi:hypothetical protein